MTDHNKSIVTKGALGSVLLVSIPTVVGLIASTKSEMSVEDLGKLIAVAGVLPAIVLIGFLAMLSQARRISDESIVQAKRVADESRSREERMALRLDKVEDRYHDELVSLVRQSNASLDKNTDAYNQNTAAFRDLHQSVNDYHQQVVLMLTKNHLGASSATVMMPLATPGEVEMAKDVLSQQAKESK